MSLIKIMSNANAKILGKTIFSTSLGGGGEGGGGPSYGPFWSGWSTEPSYVSVPANGEGVNWTVDSVNSTLDVSPRTALTTFNSFFSYTGGSVDATGCTNLTTFSSMYDNTTSVNASNLTSLSYFVCSYNELVSLNVTGSTNISTLNCSFNALTTLDVSGLINLTDFNCEYNQLTEAAVNSILTTIDGFGTSNGFINLLGGANAAPTGAGLTAKTNLESRGWNVNTM